MTSPNEFPIIGHIHTKANDRVWDELSWGSSSSSNYEGWAASAGTSRMRRMSTSSTTPKRSQKHLSTIPQDQVDNEFQILSILCPVESGLTDETFSILSAGVIALSAFTTATAINQREVHNQNIHDTHQHH